MDDLSKPANRMVKQTTLKQKLIWLFVLSILLIGFFVVLLPELARLPFVKSRIDQNERNGIDGNATFYTDQEFLMDRLEE